MWLLIHFGIKVKPYKQKGLLIVKPKQTNPKQIHVHI